MNTRQQIEDTLQLLKTLSARDLAMTEIALSRLKKECSFDEILGAVPNKVGVALINIRQVYDELEKNNQGPLAQMMTDQVFASMPNNLELVTAGIAAKIDVLQEMLAKHHDNKFIHLSPIHEAVTQMRQQLTGITAEAEKLEIEREKISKQNMIGVGLTEELKDKRLAIIRGQSTLEPADQEKIEVEYRDKFKKFVTIEKELETIVKSGINQDRAEEEKLREALQKKVSLQVRALKTIIMMVPKKVYLHATSKATSTRLLQNKFKQETNSAPAPQQAETWKKAAPHISQQQPTVSWKTAKAQTVHQTTILQQPGVSWKTATARKPKNTTTTNEQPLDPSHSPKSK